MNKILIIIRGGVVQSVHSNEAVEIHIMDHDTEGIPDDEIRQHIQEQVITPRLPDSIGMVEATLKEEIKSYE